MKSLVGLSWSDKNEQRNYPFLDNSNLTLGNSGFIPNDLIVDARIYMRGCYKAETTPYVSKIAISSDRATLTITCNQMELGVVDIPYALSGITASSNNGGYNGLNVDSKFVVRNILKNGISSGMLTVNLNSIDTLQSIGEGSYEFTSNRLQFVPFVCEYLPGPQVTSVNDLFGKVVLRGESGIKVEASSPTDIEISIVGDPHFTRYGCVDNPQAEQLASFLEELVVIHRTPNNSFKTTRIQVQPNRLIDFRLKTSTGTNNNPLPLELRPAFRVTINGNTINLSMAGR